MTGPVGVAVVGCGTISHQYLRNLTSFPDLRVVGCADLDVERARQVARQYGVPVAGAPAEVIAHPDVELVVNLTIPAAHAAVAAAAVAAGRHVYNEKPFALDRESGTEVIEAAAAAGVRLGCAPDTFLGAGLQTAARLVAEGAIGTPLTALTLLQTPGPESWHPSPEFLFKPGAGPLFDMGPYYLTALVTLFGPAERVAAVARRAREERVVGSGPRAGTRFPVEVPTHTTALLEFAAGQAATMVFSFDSPLPRLGFIEITGTEATMELPDPNTFDGAVRLRRALADDWVTVPAEGATAGRGLGVLDMAQAIRAGRPHRATGELGLHVLDTMLAVAGSAERGEFLPVGSTCEVPGPLPAGWDPAQGLL
ncbi:MULTISPECIES: Gfo/Idh/MocA family protein [Streptosporangium]|uniref:Dehydrogenase n=1 Tax=Streptosporangium brasiliense TaxID=47480 RepID=A0ABT9RH76_9ACTN|nr:Gfo/Idh/MocA family oxidoreductase [Streptosporangium brasiliense]MDP9867715.1 putative dehydrogenase [Streptosporangium brasiliense]